MRSLFIFALLLLALPASAVAHGGQSHTGSSSLPQLDLLMGDRNLNPQQLMYGASDTWAVAARGGNLRLALKRTRKGTLAYQQIGRRSLRLPQESFKMSSGLTDGVRVKLFKDGVLQQQSSFSWCPAGEAPLREGGSQTMPLISAKCGEAMSRYIETGIDNGWVSTPNIGPVFTATEETPSLELRQGSLILPTPGDYRLQIIIDPKRVLHLSRRSSLSRTFNVRITQQFYDDNYSPEEPPEESLAASSGILPDLKVMPATELSLYQNEGTPEFLTFSSLVWNDSKGKLVISGRRSRSSSKSMAAYQTVTDAKGKAKRTFRIGKLVWDNTDGHNHWHYDGLARYRILKDGKPVAESGKIGFCFVNTTPVDSRLFPPVNKQDQSYGNLGCGFRWSLAVGMELDGGWGDMYSQSVSGQAFDTTALPNGNYVLQVKANDGPYATIRERRRDNNLSHRKFQLLGEPGARYLEVEPWDGDPSENFSLSQ